MKKEVLLIYPFLKKFPLNQLVVLHSGLRGRRSEEEDKRHGNEQ